MRGSATRLAIVAGTGWVPQNVMLNEVGFGWFGKESLSKIIRILLWNTLVFTLCSPASAQFVQQAAFPVPAGTAAFGYDVSISADGNTAIVGAPNEDDYLGGAYIYNRVNGAWTQTAHLVGSGAVPSTSGALPYVEQGSSVAISADGNTAIIGSPFDSDVGAAWVFVLANGVWTQQGGKLVVSTPLNEVCAGSGGEALSADGNTAAVVGSCRCVTGNAEVVWVFVRSDGVWTQQRDQLIGSGQETTLVMGNQSVAISADGNTIIDSLGSYGIENYSSGAAWVFTRENGVWAQQGDELVGAGEQVQAGLGSSVALSADGNTAVLGGPADNGNVGAAWVFARSNGAWSQEGPKLVGSNAVGQSLQGSSVAISGDGQTIAVGGLGDSSGVGAAWVFQNTNGAWSQVGGKLSGGQATPETNQNAVALSGDGGTLLLAGLFDNGIGEVWAFDRFAGSLAHLASGAGWTTTFTLVNTGLTAGQVQMNFFGDDGSPLQLPFTFPQQPSPSPLVASTLNQSLAANSLLIVDTQQASNPNAQVGSAQLLTSHNVGGFAVFEYNPTGQEAVVPLETRNAPFYVLPFDNTGELATGVAIANIAAEPAEIVVVIRDETGAELYADTIMLAGQGHTSFMLTNRYSFTTGKRGTIQFDTPASGQIAALGLRANGGALTTLPVLAQVPAGGGSMAQVASGGGWQTTFTLVNTGTTSAQVQLSFFDDNGNALALPLSFVQSGTATTASTVSQTIAAGATLVVLTQGGSTGASVVGSAQLTTTGNVGGFAIFRYNPTGQEAAVPLETGNASAYVLAFDDTNGLATGVALANVTNQATNVPVTVRDDSGTTLGTSNISLAANGHTSFVLPDAYAFAAGKRGTVEFDTPNAGQISVLGLRATVAGAVTTVPVLSK
jgi:hypothetical protein